jgi:hypothetical protein
VSGFSLKRSSLALALLYNRRTNCRTFGFVWQFLITEWYFDAREGSRAYSLFARLSTPVLMPQERDEGWQHFYGGKSIDGIAE